MKNKSFYEILVNTAEHYNKETALYYEKKRYTYHQVLQETNKLADALVTLGIKKNDVVTVCLPNTPEAVFAFYAISKIGAICYEVHPKTTKTMMKRFLQESGSHILLVLNIFIKEYENLTDELPLTIISCNPFEQSHPLMRMVCHQKGKTKKANIIPYHRLKTTIKAQNTPLLPLDTCVYLNSGGTSGEPKIIELNALAINNLANEGITILGITDPHGIYMLGVLPMFHGFGLCMGIHSPLMHGAAVSLMTKFNPQKTIKLIKQKRCSILIGVPGLFKSLLKQPKFFTKKLKNLDVAYVGGDFVPSELTKCFNDTMLKYGSQARLFEGYGLTETVTVCNVNTKQANRKHSVGRPVGDFKNKIFSITDKIPLPPFEVGEIAVSGTSIMNGYLHDEALTNQTFLVDEEQTKWVLTGDYGYLDADGYLYFKQRLKRIVKISGVIICPSDVENAVNQIPEIFEAYATDIKDDARGSMIKLFVTKNQNLKIADQELITILKAKIKEEVSIYAVPKEIVFLDKMPKTDVGKIDSKYLESIK